MEFEHREERTLVRHPPSLVGASNELVTDGTELSKSAPVSLISTLAASVSGARS
jgi:hypothetical protein